MIALDTNVLLRFLLDDDAEQAKLAQGLMQTLNAENPGFIGRETVLELAWVLRRSYKLTREQVADALIGLLQGRHFVVEQRDDLMRAIQRYVQGGPELADILVLIAGERAGAREMVTFDRRASQLDGVRLLES